MITNQVQVNQHVIQLNNVIRHLLALFMLCLLAACQPKTDAPTIAPTLTSAAVATQWMDLFLHVERYAPGYRPPVAARALGYIGLAMYETVVPGSAEYQSIAARFPGLVIPKPEVGKTYRWDVAANETCYGMMKRFFPHVVDGDKARIEALHQQLSVTACNTDELTRSRAFGQAMAAAVFTFSTTDAAGHEAYLRNQPADYVPPTGVGKWQPAAPDFGKALLPYWGRVRTFAASDAEKIARPPVTYNTSMLSPMFAQGLEVYTTTTPLSYEQQWMAEFWSDDIYKLTFEPAGRWLAIAQQVVKQENVSLQKAAYTYAKLGLGLNDISVACWGSKYIYNVERPISYINRAINPSWKPKLNNPLSSVYGLTPPFPAYPSGHSCFGAVAAEVLTDIYGANYALTDRCHEGRTEFIGTPRSFNNFYEMATENAMSRIPLGVHYRMDCEEGLRMGYAIGRSVNRLPWRKR